MPCLLDTGILLRMFQYDDPARPLIRQAVASLLEQKVQLFAAVQNVAEFWNVSTRPASSRGGYGWTLKRVESLVRLIEQKVTVVSESNESYLQWKQLLISLKVMGVQTHDARLVSVMMSLGITDILTLNTADFQRYPGIRALTPEQISAAGLPSKQL